MNFSFFIPTYRREQPLRVSISSIFKYWNQDFDKIIISDNNTDNLANKVVEEFDENFINYSGNKENIGIDRNMLKFLDLCNTRYCWLLGDDDSLNNKSYSSIKPLLSDNLDFIVLLNGQKTEGYSDGIYEINSIDLIGKAFLAFWDKIPFGNLIINVEQAKCLDFDKHYSKYIGTSHAYSGVLWEMALSEFSTGKFGVVTAKNIETFDVSKTWVASSLRIYLKEIPLWFELLPESIKCYSDKAYNSYLKSIFKPYSLFNLVGFGKSDKDNNIIIKSAISKMALKYKIKWSLASFLHPTYLLYNKIKR